MRDFLQNSKEISGNIKKLDAYSAEIFKCVTLKQDSVLTEEEEKDLDKRIETLDEMFNALCKKIKAAIKMNENETLDLKMKKGNKSVVETRELCTYRNWNDLSKALRKHQDVQCTYKDKEFSKLKELYLAANPEATEKDFEKLADKTQGEALLASALALGSHTAQSVLIQAKNRKMNIEKIVERIDVLVQLLVDIDRIVKKNTNVIDQISINITSAEMHTTQATRELTSALAYERRTMWIKRLLFWLVFICLAVFIVFFFKDQIFSRKSNKE